MKSLQDMNRAALLIAHATAALINEAEEVSAEDAYRNYGLEFPQAGKIATTDSFMAALCGDQLEIFPHDDPDGHIMVDMNSGSTYL